MLWLDIDSDFFGSPVIYTSGSPRSRASQIESQKVCYSGEKLARWAREWVGYGPIDQFHKVDSHKHALSIWRNLGQKVKVIHVDAHDDLDPTDHGVTCGSFGRYAVLEGLVSSYTWVLPPTVTTRDAAVILADRGCVRQTGGWDFLGVPVRIARPGDRMETHKGPWAALLAMSTKWCSAAVRDEASKAVSVILENK